MRDLLFWSALCFFFAGGCGTVEFEAPGGCDVRLLEKDELVTVRTWRKIWCVGRGLEPLSNNSTAPIIEEHGLGDVPARRGPRGKQLEGDGEEIGDKD